MRHEVDYFCEKKNLFEVESEMKSPYACSKVLHNCSDRTSLHCCLVHTVGSDHMRVTSTCDVFRQLCWHGYIVFDPATKVLLCTIHQLYGTRAPTSTPLWCETTCATTTCTGSFCNRWRNPPYRHMIIYGPTNWCLPFVTYVCCNGRPWSNNMARPSLQGDT